MEITIEKKGEQLWGMSHYRAHNSLVIQDVRVGGAVARHSREEKYGIKIGVWSMH